MKLKFTREKCRESSYFIICGKHKIGMVTAFAKGDFQGRTFYPDLSFHSNHATAKEAEQAVVQHFKKFLKELFHED